MSTTVLSSSSAARFLAHVTDPSPMLISVAVYFSEPITPAVTSFIQVIVPPVITPVLPLAMSSP